MLVKLVIMFIMTPIFINNMGKYDYGLWQIIASIIGYMGILDLGIRPAISRYIAFYNGNDDDLKIAQTYSTAFVFMVFIGFLAFLSIVFFAFNYSDLLAENSQDLNKTYQLLLLIIAAQLLISFPGFVAESTLEGLQKYHIMNALTIFNSIVSSVVLYLYITPQNALLLLAAANAIGLAIKYIAYYLILFSNKLSLSPFREKPTFSSFMELASFGFKTLLQGIASRIETAADSIIIGSILGPASVPYYTIPATLASYSRNIGMQISHVFMPLFSELTGAGANINELQKIYILGSRILVTISTLISLGLIILGQDFIRLWVGEELLLHADVLIPVIIAFTMVPLLDPLCSRFLTSQNKHGIFAKLSPISAMLNIGLSIPLTLKFGVVGTAVGSLISIVIFRLIFTSIGLKIIEIPKLSYVSKAILPSAIPAIFIGLIAFSIPTSEPTASFLVLFLKAGVISASFVILYFANPNTATERKYLTQLIKRRYLKQ